jgi:hypothetical protein
MGDGTGGNGLKGVEGDEIGWECSSDSGMKIIGKFGRKKQIGKSRRRLGDNIKLGH